MYFVKRTLYIFWNPVYRFYCFVFRPKSLGVKIIVENAGKLLMVRLSYAHKKWTFPGGGVGRNESFKQAARRELEEEVGIKIENLTEIGEYTSDRNYKKNIVKCFYLNIESSLVKIDNFEISEYGWYDLNSIPHDCSPAVSGIIEIYKKYILSNG